MSTNAAAVSKVRSGLKLNHVDVALTDRAILATLKDYRVKFIKQQTDRRKLWSSPNIFTPLKIDLERVPLADYCEYQSDCTIARSKIKLPKIGDSGVFGLITQGLYTLNQKRKFTEVDPTRYVNILNLNLPGEDIYYWMFNGYLCVSEASLESVIWPVFLEDDIVPKEFSLECEGPNANCPDNPMDAPFRCPGYLEADVVESAIQHYLRYFKRSLEDPAADGKDETR